MVILSINQELRHVEFVDIPYIRHVNNTICLTMLLPLVNSARRLHFGKMASTALLFKVDFCSCL